MSIFFSALAHFDHILHRNIFCLFFRSPTVFGLPTPHDCLFATSQGVARSDLLLSFGHSLAFACQESSFWARREERNWMSGQCKHTYEGYDCRARHVIYKVSRHLCKNRVFGMIFFSFRGAARGTYFFGRRRTRKGIQGNEARHWRAIEPRLCLIQNPFLWIGCPFA